MSYLPVDYLIFAALLFVVLFLTHMFCIRIGWRMGCKADHSITTNEHVKPVAPYVSTDPYDDEVI